MYAVIQTGGKQYKVTNDEVMVRARRSEWPPTSLRRARRELRVTDSLTHRLRLLLSRHND